MFDCTMINDELDLLEIRLHTHDPVVEKFVIIESPKTHSGKQKPLHYLDNCQRFQQFWHKIEHVVYPGYEAFESYQAWGNENSQRDEFLKVLDRVRPQDGLVFFSDLDEIVRPEKLLQAKEMFLKDPSTPVAFNLHYCLYYMNFAFDVPSRGPVLYNPDTAKEFHARFGNIHSKPTAIRWHSNAAGFENDFQNVNDAGWHFSALGGVERLKQKIASCAHIEFNVEHINNDEHLKQAIANGEVYFKEFEVLNAVNNKLTKRDVSFLPTYIQQNLNKFKQYIL